MVQTFGLLLLSLALIAQGSQLAPRDSEAEVKCQKAGQIGRAIRTLEGVSTAQGSAFCSSFLPITQKTVTVPGTGKGSATVTNTIKSTKTVTSGGGKAVTKTVMVSTCTAVTTTKKLAARADVATTATSQVPTPAILSGLPQSQITRVYRGLNLPTPSPSTVTATAGKISHTTTVVTSVTTTTVTSAGKTVTTTATREYCASPTSCGNADLQYAVYYNPEGAYEAATNQFDPTYLKSASAGGNGSLYLDYYSTTTTVGGFNFQQCSGQQISVYGSSRTFGCNNFTLEHRGYIYAATAGTYTVDVSYADDIAQFWGGAIAKEGWTAANADIDTVYGQAPAVSYQLTAGQYFPIRLVFAQSAGVATLGITCTDPSGTNLFSSGGSSKSTLVQYSCDGSAPAFPGAFGDEP